MSSSATNVSSAPTHHGNPKVNFFLDEHEALTVTIDTARLHIRSVEASEKDYSSYAALFGDKAVMEKFATGETKTKEQMQDRIDRIWRQRWHANDPYSALAIFKNDTDEFIGHVAIGHGDAPGQSELAYLFMQNHWDHRYGTEAVTAVVKKYAPATVQKGYKLEGKTLEKITATARHDNPFSARILERLGMHKTGEEDKHGSLRYFYFIELSELQT